MSKSDGLVYILFTRDKAGNIGFMTGTKFTTMVEMAEANKDLGYETCILDPAPYEDWQLTDLSWLPGKK